MITAEAVINLAALRHNYEQLKQKCGNKPIIAVLKGDAYGHDALKTAQALPQAEMFAVSRIEEALELREGGITHPILLLEGCFCPADLQHASALGLETVIHCKEQLAHLQSTPISTPLKVWLKLDTGMHRLGIHPCELHDYITQLEATQKLSGPVGFISHLSCADNLTSPATSAQVELFLAQTAHYAGAKSIANSAGILYWPESHLDYMRSGIALYGISPNQNDTGQDHGLRCVMTLRSQLIAIRKHKSQHSVGYNQSWTAPRDTHIGVIAMGYGDGYPCSAPTGTPVYVNGRLVPIVGRVSMDMITVDLGPNLQDNVGDNAEFWGENLPIEHVANHIGTIAYELVIKLTKRVHKRFMAEPLS